MGISGFHSSTKHFLRPTTIEKFRGCRLGCDVSAWLHRGAVPYAWEIHHGLKPWSAIKGGLPPWVEFPMKMIHMLRSYDIELVLVFDGRRSPAKAPTSESRSERKKVAKAKAIEFLKQGRKEEALKMLQQAVDVTHDMASDLILELKKRRIPFIVAPYEADAQLAYFSKRSVEEGGVHAVVSEDSDMVAYGCECVLFKCGLDGRAEELRRDVMLAPVSLSLEYAQRTAESEGSPVTITSSEVTQASSGDQGRIASAAKSRRGRRKSSQPLSFEGWNDEQIRLVCVLAGCDFLPSLKGMGFKTAHAMVARNKTAAKTLRYMRQEPRYESMQIHRKLNIITCVSWKLYQNSELPSGAHLPWLRWYLIQVAKIDD